MYLFTCHKTLSNEIENRGRAGDTSKTVADLGARCYGFSRLEQCFSALLYVIYAVGSRLGAATPREVGHDGFAEHLRSMSSLLPRIEIGTKVSSLTLVLLAHRRLPFPMLMPAPTSKSGNIAGTRNTMLIPVSGRRTTPGRSVRAPPKREPRRETEYGPCTDERNGCHEACPADGRPGLLVQNDSCGHQYERHEADCPAPDWVAYLGLVTCGKPDSEKTASRSSHPRRRRETPPGRSRGRPWLRHR